MVRTVASTDKETTREVTRHLDGSFVCFGAAGGEEDTVQITGSNLGNRISGFTARFGHELGGDNREFHCLPLDRLDHAGLTVSEIAEDELGREVQVAMPGRIPEVGALGPRDNGTPLASLRPPGHKHMSSVTLFYHAFRRGCFGCRWLGRNRLHDHASLHRLLSARNTTSRADLVASGSVSVRQVWAQDI